MQNIDSIRIMQVDGLDTGAAGMQAGDATPAMSGNLAEQAVRAALSPPPMRRSSISSSRKWGCRATGSAAGEDRSAGADARERAGRQPVKVSRQI